MAVPVQLEPHAQEIDEQGGQAVNGGDGPAETVYLETDGEPYLMESLCMSCYENVQPLCPCTISFYTLCEHQQICSS